MSLSSINGRSSTEDIYFGRICEEVNGRGTMSTTRTEFPALYSSMILKLWTDAAFSADLKNDAKSALAGAGIKVPDEAIVNIIYRNLDQTAKLADQLAMWEEGIRTGIYDIIIPVKPADNSPLAAEGGDPCCCCPCSCCA